MSATATPAPGNVTATAKQGSVTPIGRTTTGDNGGGRQPAAVKAARAKAAATKAAPAKIVTASAMGPSGYREKFGVLTDAQIVGAVRASFGPSDFSLTDEQIVGAIGWALTVGTAIERVTALLTAGPPQVLPKAMDVSTPAAGTQPTELDPALGLVVIPPVIVP
jgi:hypothetical protein